MVFWNIRNLCVMNVLIVIPTLQNHWITNPTLVSITNWRSSGEISIFFIFLACLNSLVCCIEINVIIEMEIKSILHRASWVLNILNRRRKGNVRNWFWGNEYCFCFFEFERGTQWHIYQLWGLECLLNCVNSFKKRSLDNEFELKNFGNVGDSHHIRQTLLLIIFLLLEIKNIRK